MDFQNRAGSKPRSGGMASQQQANIDRRERLRKLALETIDLDKDPYFMKNHLGSYECKLCLTIHPNEGSYLAHTQGKKHQTQLARRAAKEAKELAPTTLPQFNNAPATTKDGKKIVPQRVAIKIGRPGYKVTKVRDPSTRQVGLLFQIQYPEINLDVVKPRHRFMSAYEQKVEEANRHYQYLIFACEPYETVAFRVNSFEVDNRPGRLVSYWDVDNKTYHLQFFYKQ